MHACRVGRRGAGAPGTVVGPGHSIQAAVDAANPGDTIRVFGENRENVVIQTDGLTLRGAGATIRPPATPAANACFDPTVPGETVKGICVSGDIDFDTGAVSRVVSNVTVSSASRSATSPEPASEPSPLATPR
jgi:nitrous oxidase accessory protein NosD